MAIILQDWDIRSGLLCASRSTLLAMAPPPGESGWPVRLLGGRTVMHLAGEAIACSGVARQGRHIVDPRLGQPVSSRFRTWAVAPTGAWADALSTALMAMSYDEIVQFGRRRVGTTLATVRAFFQHQPEEPITEYHFDAA
ncbi:MAG: FAD:protein FMN transferase [Thermoguttaceae bacterium]|jgi:hypothetical protein